MSSRIDDEQLRQFQLQSDRAFLDMQTKADQDMAAFLQAYSDEPTLVSFRTPDFSWGEYNEVAPATAALPQGLAGSAQSLVSKLSTPHALDSKLKNAAKFAANAMDKAHEEIVNQSKAYTQGNFDVSQVGKNLKEQVMAHAQDLKQGAQGVLQHTTNDLGERAKREAAAMREAAKRVMQEESSLRGMAQRAKSEFNAAKDRIAAELLEVGQSAVGELQGVAASEIKEIGDQAGAVLQGVADGNINFEQVAKQPTKASNVRPKTKQAMSNPAFKKQDYSKIITHDAMHQGHK